MTAWNGPRHRSWASDTMIFAVVFVIVLFTNVITSWLTHAPPPSYLQGLLGASSAAFFGAAGSDKNKREAEIADDARVAKTRATEIGATADRAEAKADTLAGLARAEHPEHHELDEPPITDSEGGS